MGEQDEREAADDGGETAAAPRPPKPWSQKSRREESKHTHTRSTDDAAKIRAEGYLIEQEAAAARLGLGASTEALKHALDREKDTADRLSKAQEKILELSIELGQLRGAGKGDKAKKKKIKIKAELKREEMALKWGAVHKGIQTLGPAASLFAPKLLLLSNRWFPTALAAAETGEKTAQAAMIRLFLKLQSDDPDSEETTIREGLERLAGEEDWPLIVQGVAELAAQPPQPARAQTNGAAH